MVRAKLVLLAAAGLDNDRPMGLPGSTSSAIRNVFLEIDRRFAEELPTRYPGDEDRVRRMAIVSFGPEPVVRMAHLAVVGSFKVNGVAELHSTLLRDQVLCDFAELWPERFTNITNGVTPRRFLRLANPGLSELITEAIGEGGLNDLERLRELEPAAADPSFREAWSRVKRDNKERLAGLAHRRHDVVLDPSAMFDVHVKRIHLYMRQLLKVLHRLPPAEDRPLGRRRAPRGRDGREGCARVLHGQAGGAADQRRGRHRQPRSGGGGAAGRLLPAQLRRHDGRVRHSGR